MVNPGDQNIVKAVTEQAQGKQDKPVGAVSAEQTPRPELNVSIQEQIQLQSDLKIANQGAGVSKPVSLNTGNSNTILLI